MNIHWWELFLGLLLIFSGSVKLVTGEDGVYWGAPVPAWVGILFLPIGMALLVVSIRALLRGEGKPQPPKTYTDEDITQAEARMDAMYLRDHGEPPEKPGKDV